MSVITDQRLDARVQERAIRSVSAKQQNGLMQVATMVILVGLVLAALASAFAQTPTGAFAYAAPFIGVALCIALIVEGRAGLRNLIRIDTFMLTVLYLLTFLEFLFPQDRLPEQITLDAAQTATLAAIFGFAGIAIGRHFAPAKYPIPERVTLAVTPKITITLIIAAAFLGHLYMLLAVNFDVFEMLYQMSRPRFSQPWSRGRLGSLSTLLNEVGLLIYLVPPLCGTVLAHYRRYSFIQLGIAGLCLSLVLYGGFAGGTRNIFLSHLITFLVAYVLVQKRIRFLKIALVGGSILALAAFATFFLTEIRTVGLQNFDLEDNRRDTLFIDLNLVNVSVLVENFPEYVDFLDLEIPVNAIVRPIPRAIWPGKPEGLSITIEEVIGVSNMTLSATFVGELWMSGGFVAILIGGLVFGWLAACWNRVGARAKSNLDMILFAAGFFPAGICMRSFMSVMPPMLPVIAFALFLRRRRRKKGRGR